MPSLPPIIVFDVSDPRKQGVLQSIENGALDSTSKLIRFAGYDTAIRLVTRTGNTKTPFKDFDVTGATLSLAVGPTDLAPTAGFSSGTYTANDVGPVTATADAAEMAAALNANPGIDADGGVSVTLVQGGYRIEWNEDGERPDELTWFPGSLTPPTRTTVEILVLGDATTHEVRYLKIVQDYWAASDTWTQEAIGAIAVEEITAGAAGSKAVYRIYITGAPFGGQFKVSASQAQIFKFNCTANNGSNASNIVLSGFTGRTIAAMNSTAFDLYDDVGACRVWYNVNSTGVAPTTPPGGRLLAVAVAASLPAGYADEATYIYALTNAAIDGDAKFVTSSAGFLAIKITQSVLGARPQAADVNSFLTLSAYYAGSSGSVDQKYLRLYDSAGSVDVWFNISAATEKPVNMNGDRYIEITSIGGNTAAQVATALQVALDADPEFIATVLSNAVTVTQAFTGPRSTPLVVSSNFGLVLIQSGYLISGTVPYNATAAQIKTALGDLYTVGTDDKKPFEWVATSNAVGPQAAIAAEDLTLQWVRVWVGNFTFNTRTCAAAFLASSASELDAIMEVQYQFPDSDPVKFYQAPVTVSRSLIDTSALNPLNPLNPNNRTFQEARINMAIADFTGSVLQVFFDVPYADTGWTLIAHNVSNDVDAAPEVITPGTIFGRTGGGFFVNFSSVPLTNNFRYYYFTRQNS